MNFAKISRTTFLIEHSGGCSYSILGKYSIHSNGIFRINLLMTKFGAIYAQKYLTFPCCINILDYFCKKYWPKVQATFGIIGLVHYFLIKKIYWKYEYFKVFHFVNIVLWPLFTVFTNNKINFRNSILRRFDRLDFFSSTQILKKASFSCWDKLASTELIKDTRVFF